MHLASNKPPSNEGVGFDAIYPGVSQKVAFAASSAQSVAFQPRTTVIELLCDNPCFITIGKTTDNSGAGPTAAADGTSMYIPANVFIKVGVPNQGVGQLAVIRVGSTSGNLYITEGA